MVITRSQSAALHILGIMTDEQSNAGVSNPKPLAPQVTVIHEPVHLSNFSGKGTETVHQFISRITEECTRRNATTDGERISILKNRISMEPDSHAGKLVRTGKFSKISTFQEFTTELRNHFQGHTQLGALHSLLKISRRIKECSYADPYDGENATTSIISELFAQLADTEWVQGEVMKTEDVKGILGYLIFSGFLDDASYQIARTLAYKRNDELYDLCRRISEKRPEGHQHAVLYTSVNSKVQPHSEDIPSSTSPSRSRPFSRGHQSNHRSSSPRTHHGRRSKSRARNATCHRCRLPGHYSTDCRVVLDSTGKHSFNPQKYCSFHKRTGHSLEECRQYNSQSSPQSQPKNYMNHYQRNPS